MAELEKNIAELTPEFCRTATDRLVFNPASLEESKFIVFALQEMGFKYYHAEYAEQLAKTAKGCIYLDGDKTIMIGDDRRTDGIQCSVANFNAYFMRAEAAAGARLNAEDVANRTLIFYPRSFHEALHAVGVLAVLGATPETAEGVGNTNFGAITMRGTKQGIVSRKGRLSAGPASDDMVGARVCTQADFGTPLDPDAGKPDNSALLAAFNEMSARLGTLTAWMENMSERLGAVEHEILPRTIEKKPNPGLGHG
jgi:hypothetical protein